MIEDEMVRQHHRLNEDEFEQTLEDNEGQGSLTCRSAWCHPEMDTTQELNNSLVDLQCCFRGTAK